MKKIEGKPQKHEIMPPSNIIKQKVTSPAQKGSNPLKTAQNTAIVPPSEPQKSNINQKVEHPVKRPLPKDEEEIKYDDLLDQLSESVQRRLVVNLPLNSLQAKNEQVNAALDSLEKHVKDISDDVNETHDALIQLSTESRSVSEMSMKLNQTTEAVVSKVSVMADWIDGLEKVGSGLKIQFIEWFVKFISFLSSLLLLVYQTVRKANPARLWSKKTEIYEIKKRYNSEEEDEDD